MGKEEISREIRKYFNPKENENIILKFVRHAKAMLRWEFIALNVYIRKKERSNINNLNLILSLE